MNTNVDLAAVVNGRRLEPPAAAYLLTAADILELGAAADMVRRRFHPGDTVTFIIDRNINYTNICESECHFCAFFRQTGHAEGYVLDHEVIYAKIDEAVAAGATQIMLQGGLNPALRLDYFTGLFRGIKERFDITVHSLSPAEIDAIARREGLTVAETLTRLRAAGLDSLPGGGAEILVDAVRLRVSPHKISAGRWLEVMRAAHHLGIATTATMVIGMGESFAQRVEHFRKIRELQDETGGFRAFIIWSFQPGNTALGGEKASAWEYLRTLAVARLFLDNIPHIQGSWVTQGQQIGQLTLAFGANDLGSIMLEENVVRAAGVSYEMSVAAMVRLIRAAGKIPAERDTCYRIIRQFEEGDGHDGTGSSLRCDRWFGNTGSGFPQRFESAGCGCFRKKPGV